MRQLFLVLIVFCTSSAPLLATEKGVVVRIAKVYSNASSNEESIGHLAAGTSVSVFSRAGGWKEVYAEKQQIIGWVRSYQVREGYSVETETGIETETDSRGFLSGLASISRQVSGFFGNSTTTSTSSGTATIGVRGLSEEQIRNAKPDLQELKKMKGFASNESRLKTFVATGGLSAQKVKHLKTK